MFDLLLTTGSRYLIRFPYKLDPSFKVSGSTARHEKLKQTSRLSAKTIQLVASLPDNWSIMKEDLQLQKQVALQLEGENLKQAFRRPQPRQVLSRVSGSTACFEVWGSTGGKL